MNNFMKLARECAEHGANAGEGGPFGAVITDKDGNRNSDANKLASCSCREELIVIFEMSETFVQPYKDSPCIKKCPISCEITNFFLLLLVMVALTKIILLPLQHTK